MEASGTAHLAEATKSTCQPQGRSIPRRLEWIARLGFVTRGVIYALVGTLVFFAALSGEAIQGSPGATVTIAQQPFGSVLLVLCGVGLGLLAVWRVIQALWDPEGRGRAPHGVFARIGLFSSGLIHAGLAVIAFQMLIFRDLSGAMNHALIGEIMRIPFGQFLVALCGFLVVCVGLGQVLRARSTGVAEDHHLTAARHPQRKVLLTSARIGLASRGVAFGFVGGYMIKGAFDSAPGEIKGLAGALRVISSQPWGTINLVVLAVGLLTYGAFEVMLARYKKLPRVGA